MQPSYRSPLSDDTEKSVKKSRGRTCYAPPCSTLFIFFRVEPNVLESQKFFYEIIFDPSETKRKSTKSKETYSLQKN